MGRQVGQLLLSCHCCRFGGYVFTEVLGGGVGKLVVAIFFFCVVFCFGCNILWVFFMCLCCLWDLDGSRYF